MARHTHSVYGACVDIIRFEWDGQIGRWIGASLVLSICHSIIAYLHHDYHISCMSACVNKAEEQEWSGVTETDFNRSRRPQTHPVSSISSPQTYKSINLRQHLGSELLCPICWSYNYIYKQCSEPASLASTFYGVSVAYRIEPCARALFNASTRYWQRNKNKQKKCIWRDKVRLIEATQAKQMKLLLSVTQNHQWGCKQLMNSWIILLVLHVLLWCPLCGVSLYYDHV